MTIAMPWKWCVAGIANTSCSPIYTESVNEENWESLCQTISAHTENERMVMVTAEYIDKRALYEKKFKEENKKWKYLRFIRS